MNYIHIHCKAPNGDKHLLEASGTFDIYTKFKVGELITTFIEGNKTLLEILKIERV